VVLNSINAAGPGCNASAFLFTNFREEVFSETRFPVYGILGNAYIGYLY
jgi:hypothetical protein